MSNYNTSKDENKVVSKVKVCTKCKVEKSAVNFYKDNSKKDGLYSSCKECASKKDKAVYYKDPEKRRATARKYFEANKEKYNYYKPYNPQYYSSEKSKMKKRARDMRRRALKRRANIEHRITHTTIEDLFIKYNGKCAYCDKCVKGEYHIDHNRPLSRGGGNEFENLVLSCPTCNFKKGTMTSEEFRAPVM